MQLRINVHVGRHACVYMCICVCVYSVQVKPFKNQVPKCPFYHVLLHSLRPARTSHCHFIYNSQDLVT